MDFFKGRVYWIIIFCVFTLFPLINRNTYTPGAIPLVETRLIVSLQTMTRPIKSITCNVQVPEPVEGPSMTMMLPEASINANGTSLPSSASSLA